MKKSMTSDPAQPPDPSTEENLAKWMRDLQNRADEEIWVLILRMAVEHKGLNDFIQQKWLQLGVAELARRNSVALRASIDRFSVSSDRYSNEIVCLTWALIILTGLLLILTGITAVPIVQGWLR
jgi:hypothetical protein